MPLSAQQLKKIQTKRAKPIRAPQPENLIQKFVDVVGKNKVLFLVIFLLVTGGLFALLYPFIRQKAEKNGDNRPPSSRNTSSDILVMKSINRAALYNVALSTPSCEAFQLTHFGSKTGNKKAKITLVAERHDRRSQAIQCVEYLAQQKREEAGGAWPHSILVEMEPRGLETDCELEGYSNAQDRTCVGWDDRSAIAEFENQEAIFYIMVSNKEDYNLLQKKKRSNAQIDQYFLNKKALLQQEFDAKLKEAESLGISIDEVSGEHSSLQSQDMQSLRISSLEVQAVQQILDSRKQGKTYKEIFKPFEEVKDGDYMSHARNDFIKDILLKSFQKRNLSLITALANIAKHHPDQGVIVVAGAAHIIPVGNKQTDKSARDLLAALERERNERPYDIALDREVLDIERAVGMPSPAP